MNETAITILQQLGDRQFCVMTGAKEIYSNGNDLCFKIGKNKSKANFVKVTLNANDTYTMEFRRVTKDRINMKTFEYVAGANEEIKKVDGVYCNMLQEIFTNTTGLYTTLY